MKKSKGMFIVILLLLIYIFTVFVTLELNPMQWSILVRFLFALAILVVAFISIFPTDFEEGKH